MMPVMASCVRGFNDNIMISQKVPVTHKTLAHPCRRPSRHRILATSRPHLSTCQCSSSTSSSESTLHQSDNISIHLAESQHEQKPQQLEEQQQQISQQGTVQQPAAPVGQLLTCRRCFERFDTAYNTVTSCRFHPAMYTGGEVAKAIGFVRESAEPQHQLGAVVGRTGLMRFWDCCGAADSDAPGCVSGHHVSFDDELNGRMGWTE